MASRLVVSVSTATTPNSCARAIHFFRSSSVRTHSYLERSILVLCAPSLRAMASAMGVRAPLGASFFSLLTGASAEGVGGVSGEGG